MYSRFAGFFWCFILSLLLSACAAMPNIDPAAVDALGKDKAILIFTVTNDRGPAAIMAGADFGGSVHLDLVFHSAALEGGKFFAESKPEEEFSLKMRATPFEAVWGRIYVQALPSGRYVLREWGITQLMGNLGSRSVSPRSPPPPLEFELAPGSVTYIGNIHAHLKWARNFLGMSLLDGGLVEIRNEAERDLGAVYATYPMLKSRVEIRPLPLGLWVRQP